MQKFMSKRKRHRETWTFEPDHTVRVILKEALRKLGNRRGLRTRLINLALRTHLSFSRINAAGVLVADPETINR